MYATCHVVFAGPGSFERRLIEGVEGATVHAAGDDLAPRITAVCATAAAAERVAALLHEHGLRAAVAGPEQPPANAGWQVAASLETEGADFLAVDPDGRRTPLPLDALAHVTTLEWRDEGTLDRAALLAFADGRAPVALRATALGPDGLRRLGDLLDACAVRLPPGAPVRSRALDLAVFRDAGLGGDLVPLALAVIAAVDTTPGALPQPLAPSPQRRTSTEFAVTAPTGRGSAAVATWGLWCLSLATLLLVVALLGVAAWQLDWSGLAAAALAVMLGAWASQRLYWARWLERATFGGRRVLPAWPLPPEEAGRPPAPIGLTLEAGVLAMALVLRAGPSPAAELARAVLWTSPVWGGLGLLGLWERLVAPHWTEK